MSLKRFRKWIRVVFITDWILWIALFCVVGIWLLEWSLYLFVIWVARASAPDVPENELYIPDVVSLHAVAVLFISFMYGLYRAETFHPISNKSCGVWLTQTPWSYSLPAPLGPIHIVWQDIFTLLTLMVLACLPPHDKVSALHVPFAFLCAYCGMHMFPLIRLESYRFIFLSVMIVGVAVFLYWSPIALLLLSTALYGVIYYETRKSLEDFPYTERRRMKLGLVPYELQSRVEVGLPIVPATDATSGFTFIRFLNQRAALVGATVGGLLFAIGFQFRDEPNLATGLRYIHYFIAMIFIMVRTISYLGGHGPPISLLGRIATRRWTTPGYDIMFAGPLAALAVATLLPELLMLVGVPAEFAIPLSTFVSIWLCFGMRPTFEEWNYTGHFSMPMNRAMGRQQFVRV